MAAVLLCCGVGIGGIVCCYALRLIVLVWICLNSLSVCTFLVDSLMFGLFDACCYVVCCLRCFGVLGGVLGDSFVCFAGVLVCAVLLRVDGWFTVVCLATGFGFVVAFVMRVGWVCCLLV